VPGRLQHQSQLVTDPRLTLELGKRGWAQRRLGGALVDIGGSSDDRERVGCGLDVGIPVGSARLGHR
jgi:hypothetical protein